MSDAVHNAWLGEMQRELGVLKSNLMLRDLQLEDMQRRAATDADLIEALKKRALGADTANAELKAQIKAQRATQENYDG